MAKAKTRKATRKTSGRKVASRKTRTKSKKTATKRRVTKSTSRTDASLAYTSTALPLKTYSQTAHMSDHMMNQSKQKQASPKKYLTLDQEFEIMKLVLDKFLWLGFLIMAFGLYLCITAAVRDGLYYILAGVIILIIFVWIIIKEYEVIIR